MEMGFYLMFLNFLCSCNVIPMIIYVIQAIQEKKLLSISHMFNHSTH